MAVKPLLAGCVDRGGGNWQYKGNGDGQNSGIAGGYNAANVAGGCIYVNWADLQPLDKGSLALSQAQALTGVADPSGTHGGAAGFWSTGTALINYFAGYCAASSYIGIVRVGCGIFSPVWLTNGNYQVAGFAYADPNTPSQAGTCAAWWTPQYVASYANLMSLLATAYDNSTGNNGSLGSFTCTGGMTAFGEPLIRGVSSNTNVANLVQAGYYLGAGSITTAGSDLYALAQAQAACSVFVNTYVDHAFNPYQSIYCGANINSQVYTGAITSWKGAYNAGTTYSYGQAVTTGSGSSIQVFVYINGTASSGHPTTNATYWGPVNTDSNDAAGNDLALMDNFRSAVSVAGLALIGNNSFRTSYSFVSGSSPIDVMYKGIKKRMPAGKIQTAASGAINQTNSPTPLTDCLDDCLAAGIGWVELPGTYGSTAGGTNAGNNSTLTFLPTGTAGNVGTGGDANHGAAYYTTQMQALPQPNVTGGSSGGAEYPASTTGGGIA